MGLIIDDPLTCDHCPLCFPPNESPQYLLASFTGIERGSYYRPSPVNPPNKIYKLWPGLVECSWIYFDDEISISWGSTDLVSAVKVETLHVIHEIFTGRAYSPCVFGFSNELTEPPPRRFTHGSCVISWVPPVAPESLSDLAESIGLEVNPTIRADFWPDDTQKVTRFVDHKTNSRIRVVKEF